MIVWLYSVFSVVCAAPAPTPAVIQQRIEEFNKYSSQPIPSPSSNQILAWQDGEVLTLLDSSAGLDQPSRAVGYLLSTASMRNLWLACQDIHFTQNSSAKEVVIYTYPDKKADWFGYLDLPWPMSNRYWVVSVSNNTTMAQATQNTHWEHPWKLKENGIQLANQYANQGKLQSINIDTHMVEDAIFTPVNQGAWIVIQIDSTYSMLIYHATTVVGGNIPRDFVTQLVKSSMEDMLQTIDEKAKTDVTNHYVGDHYLITGGNNQPVPLYSK